MKIYLISVGAALIVIGILGIIGVIGPSPSHSPWNGHWYFDQLENIGHTLAGVVLVLGGWLGRQIIARRLVIITAFAGILAGFYSLAISHVLFTANLQHPADTIFHFVIGISALLALKFLKTSSIS